MKGLIIQKPLDSTNVVPVESGAELVMKNIERVSCIALWGSAAYAQLSISY